MHGLAKQLNPGHLPDIMWDYEVIDPIIPPEVHSVTRQFNATGFHDLLGPLRAQVTTDPATGIEYALLQDALCSKSTVVVHFNPFANGLDDNMLIRASYLQHVFNGFKLSDENAHSLPMLTFAAPNASKQIKLKKHHHKSTAQGQFASLAKKYAKIISQLGFKNILIIGFSQGATMATAVASIAHEYNMNITHLAVGEPANVMVRSRVRLGRNFNASAKHLNPAIKASGITHLKTFEGAGNSVRYVLGLARMRKLNNSIASGLSKNTYIDDLEKVLAQDCIVTIGWGGLNTIAPPKVMQEIVQTSRNNQNLHQHAIHTVELRGAHHTWADQLNVLATFYAYALIR